MARKTISAGFTPTDPSIVARRHVIAVVVYDGVVIGDLAAPLEIFGRARGAHGQLAYDVQVCSQERLVTAARLRLEAPHRLTRLRRADTIIVPGTEDPTLEVPAALINALRSATDRGTRIASICTGALILAQTGVLDGRRATTHWRCAAELARRHPAIQVDPKVLYVDEGRVLTSAGAAAGLDLCLHIVRRDLGAEAAARVARESVMPLERAGGQAQFIDHTPPAVVPGQAHGADLCDFSGCGYVRRNRFAYW